MRIFIFCILINSFFLTAQENLVPNGNFETGNYNGGTDPTNFYSGIISRDSASKEKCKLFVLDSSRFRHAIDLRYIYDINLGYNFSYHFLPKRLGIGLRTGLWYRKNYYFPGGIYSRYGIKFSGDLYLDLTLWRSIHLHTGVAFQNELLWPAKDNPVQGPAKIQDWGVAIYLKPTLILFKHYLISAGINYFSFQPYEYYEIRPIISIGYKF